MGTEFKAGPVTIKGLNADQWQKLAEQYWVEVKEWLGLLTVTVETDVFGFEFRGGKFGDREDGDYYTIPDTLVMLTPESEHQEP